MGTMKYPLKAILALISGSESWCFISS